VNLLILFNYRSFIEIPKTIYRIKFVLSASVRWAQKLF